MAGIEPVTHQFGVTNPLAWYRTRPGEIALSVFVFVGCVALWWGYIRYTSLSPLVLPTPYEVLLSLIDNTRSGYLLENCWVTLSEILLGFALGSALGIALGTVAAINPLIRNVLSPYIVASQGHAETGDGTDHGDLARLRDRAKSRCCGTNMFFPTVREHRGRAHVCRL